MARLFAVAIVALIGCTAAPDASKFHQTWTKPYAQTTCIEWSDTMDDHQRFVMAGDILLTLRKKDGDGSIPADELIAGYVSDISGVCYAKFGQIGGLARDAAAIVYLDERFHP